MKPLKMLLAIAAIAPALAHAEYDNPNRYVPTSKPAYVNSTTNIGHLIGLEIYDRTAGRSLPIYYKDGKYYIAGDKGHEYQINMNNKSYANGSYYPRKMAIVSVDGVNVISGDSAGYQQSGYVINPGQYAEIKGWRKNMNETAKFYFTYPENSYASKTDRPQNTGVIGVAIFNERYVPPPLPDSPMFNSIGNTMGGASAKSRAADASGPSAPSAMAEKSELGTGHGSRELSQTVSTQFERESSRPNETITIYYDTYNHLVELGVLPLKRETTPNPFPQGNMRFAPDPKY